MRNCKLKIENYKLQIGGWSSRRCRRESRSRNLQFAFCNLQISMSLLLAFLFLLVLATIASAQTKSSCIECHIKLEDPRLSAPAKAFDNDIHKARGLSCNDCHGGDPNAD